MDLTEIYRILYSTVAEYMFFLSEQRTFIMIDYMLDHKTSLKKFKRTEIVSTTFSNHNSMKLEINNRRSHGKLTNVEIKEHAPEQPMGQIRSQKEN